MARGAAVIKAFHRHAPNGPGVYRMLGADGEVLYVGKARSIRKRILSYTTPQRQSTPHRPDDRARPSSMVFVTAETEAEALLLEANLIKQLKPRYNVLLRDDKSFPYILVTGDHEAPQHRQASRRARHQGRLFRPVRQRRRGVPHAHRRCSARSCCAPARTAITRTARGLACCYQIKRCSAPCTGEISLRRLRQTGRRGAGLPLRPQPRDPPAARRAT